MHTQCGHVQPHRSLLGGERVQRDDDEDGVAGDRVELAVGEQRLVVDVVEVNGAQLAQGGVHPADLVQAAQERLQ